VKIWPAVVDLYHFTRWLFGIEGLVPEHLEPHEPDRA